MACLCHARVWFRLLQARGYTKCETAASLGIPSRAPSRWRRQRGSLPEPRGRKPRCCSYEPRHGAPLCIKSDNGGAFIEACVQGLLAAKNVQHLFSPVRCPRYNVMPVRRTGVSAELCEAAGASAPLKSGASGN